jgi:hypothetical protein
MNALQQLAPGQANPEDLINENFATVGAAGIFGKKHSTTTGLTWGYYGGYFSSTLIADGTVTLTNTATNYVVVARASGVVSVSTTNTNWNNTATYGRLYLLTVAGGVVTAEQDHRFGDTGIVAAATGSTTGGVTLDATFVSDQSSTADSDPGAGNLRWNNATPTSATQLYIDDETADGVDLSTYFASLGDSGFIKIMAAVDEWQLWKWTAAPTDGTGYWKFTVTLQASLGTIDALDDIKVLFDDHGAAGSGGGASSVLTFTSDTGSTADSDPGAGLFKWNNATQASATQLYFDDATLDSVNLDTFYTSQGSTGFISLQQADDTTKWQIWTWTAAPTDGTGYWKFTVTLQASGGSIADNKTVYVVFMGAGGGGGSTQGTHQMPVMANAMLPQSTGTTGCGALTTMVMNSGIELQYLPFDTTTEEAAQFSLTMPKKWNAGTITAQFVWIADSASTNTVTWALQAISKGSGDNIHGAGSEWGTAQSVNQANAGTRLVNRTSATSAITIAGTPQKQDTIYFRVFRDVASDNLAADAFLISVVITITTDADTDA